MQLGERADSKVEPLSGGMKRRLTIARSLINEPELLLLDEPTTGLDPQARHVLWDRLYRLKQQGVTLVLDDPLHGRGRAAVRPAGGDGQGGDRGDGVAVRVIDRYSTREVLELRFPAGTNEGRAGSVAGVGDRTEVLPTGS